MNSINLLQEALKQREDVQAAADSAFMSGDFEAYYGLTKAFNLGVNI